MAARRWLVRCAWMAQLFVLSSLAAGNVRARDAPVDPAAEPQGRIRVLIFEDPSTDWGRRVQGQLSDLPASLEIQAARTLVGAYSPEPSPRAPGASARVAKASSHLLSAWLATSSDPAPHEGAATFIAIRFMGQAKPYTRRIAGDWSALSAGDRSAALELAALSVRSAVRSLLLDQKSENPEPTPAATRARKAARAARATPAPAPPPPRATPAPASAPSAPAAGSSAALEGALPPNTDLADAIVTGTAVATTAPPSAPVEEARRARPPEPSSPARPDAREVSQARPEPADDSAFPLDFGLELGAAWQFYGRTALGAPGVRGGVQLFGGDWGLELIGQFGLPVSARIAPASFDLQRHAALAELRFVAAERGTWHFGALLRGGLTWLRRDGTRAEDAASPLQASQAESYRSPFFGAGAIVEQRLSGAWSLSLRSVLNVETAIPTFTLVDTSGARVASRSPWSVQPSIELGVHWRW